MRLGRCFFESKPRYVTTVFKRTAKASNHRRALYHLNQSHSVKRARKAGWYKPSDQLQHDYGPSNPALCATNVGLFVSMQRAPRLAERLDFLFRMSYFEGKPGEPAHTGCPVSANEHTHRWWLAAGEKNAKGKEKIVVANEDGDDINDGRVQNPRCKSGIYFSKMTLDMSGNQLVDNILSDDPSL